MSYSTSDRPAKRVGIIQSNYIPWKGYFDFIAACDEFVLLDEVQYTRRDWRNRNRIKTTSGLQWLTIPVEVKGKYEQRIDEVRISNATWAGEHLRALQLVYGRAPHFREVWPFVEALYASVSQEPFLTRINETMIRSVAGFLGIATPIRRSDEFATIEGKNERLMSICVQLGANEYLSGPAARAYIDVSSWRDNGIEVRYKSYAGYAEYPQLHPPFEHAVTVLDVLFNAGRACDEYVRAADCIEPAHA
jgi:hypothetical protein